MFEEMADEIFAKADFPKEGNEHLWDQCVSILGNAMAMGSATMGLSLERVEFFEKQKQALVDDLLAFKAQ